MTPVELRHAVAGYPVATIRSAVEAALCECPFEHLANELGFAPLVVHWLANIASMFERAGLSLPKQVVLPPGTDLNEFMKDGMVE